MLDFLTIMNRFWLILNQHKILKLLILSKKNLTVLLFFSHKVKIQLMVDILKSVILKMIRKLLLMLIWDGLMVKNFSLKINGKVLLIQLNLIKFHDLKTQRSIWLTLSLVKINQLFWLRQENYPICGILIELHSETLYRLSLKEIHWK